MGIPVLISSSHQTRKSGQKPDHATPIKMTSAVCFSDPQISQASSPFCSKRYPPYFVSCSAPRPPTFSAVCHMHQHTTSTLSTPTHTSHMVHKSPRGTCFSLQKSTLEQMLRKRGAGSRQHPHITVYAIS